MINYTFTLAQHPTLSNIFQIQVYVQLPKASPVFSEPYRPSVQLCVHAAEPNSMYELVFRQQADISINGTSEQGKLVYAPRRMIWPDL
jgi:hypothetical protein